MNYYQLKGRCLIVSRDTQLGPACSSCFIVHLDWRLYTWL